MATFADLDDLESYLGTTFDDLGVVRRAQQQLELATARIKRETRQTLEEVTGDIVTLDGTGSRHLFLPQRPVTTITEITLDGEVVDPAQYAFDEEGVVTRLDNDWLPVWASPSWGEALQVIQVTYDHGFATIPDDLKGACMEIARRGMALEEGGVVRAQSLDNYSTTFATAEESRRIAPVDPERVIASYRAPAFA